MPSIISRIYESIKGRASWWVPAHRKPELREMLMSCNGFDTEPVFHKECEANLAKANKVYILAKKESEADLLRQYAVAAPRMISGWNMMSDDKKTKLLRKLHPRMCMYREITLCEPDRCNLVHLETMYEARYFTPVPATMEEPDLRDSVAAAFLDYLTRGDASDGTGSMSEESH
jgi:hypothetical protein